jgi:hypothetical protein
MYPLVNETLLELVPSYMHALDVKELQNKNRASTMHVVNRASK